MVPCGDAADDVAAEVLGVAFERREAYDPAYSSAMPWLFGIAANLACQHHRRTARRRDVHERLVAEEGPEPHPAPEERSARLAETDPVAEAILDLPDRDREPLLLLAWADLTYDDDRPWSCGAGNLTDRGDGRRTGRRGRGVDVDRPVGEP